MSKIKEYYFDEINNQEEVDIDDSHFYEQWKEKEAFNSSVISMVNDWEDNHERDFESEQEIVATFDRIQEDINDSELPSWMHPLL